MRSATPTSSLSHFAPSNQVHIWPNQRSGAYRSSVHHRKDTASCFSMSHLLTIAAAVWTILVFATPHLGPRQLSLNMLNIHELSDRRRTRGGWGSSSSSSSRSRGSSSCCCCSSCSCGSGSGSGCGSGSGSGRGSGSG